MKQKEYPVRKGQVLEVTVSGYTSEGMGVARVDGLAVFIHNAIEGERLKIKIAHLGHTAASPILWRFCSPVPTAEKRIAPMPATAAAVCSGT